MKGPGQKGVAGEDGDSLAEGLVGGGLAPAQVVVVHGREVVVDQAVRVDHLGRAGKREHLRALPSDRLARGQREHRSDALSPGEEAVAHGAVDRLRPGVIGRQGAVESRLHRTAQLFERRGRVRRHQPAS